MLQVRRAIGEDARGNGENAADCVQATDRTHEQRNGRWRGEAETAHGLLGPGF